MHCNVIYTRRGARHMIAAIQLATLAVSFQLCGYAEPRVELISHGQIAGEVYESVYSVRTGNGEFDRIQLHRVIRENRGEPIESDRAIMLLHGDVWGFHPAFMPDASPSFSLPVYLAERGTDVWGVNLAWTLVPSSATDFSFMRNWGLQHDVDDLDTALDTAGKIRKRHDGMTVLGWSRGGYMLYGLLNQESQRPCSRRRVKGAIPFDTSLKFSDGRALAFACNSAADVNSALQAGQVAADFRPGFPTLGALAEDDPNGSFPFFGRPLTNLQAALEVGAAGFVLFGPSFTPEYHFVAGTFPNDDVNQVPTGLRYTDVSRWIKFMRAASPFMPNLMLRDTYQISCQTGPSGPFDDHLQDIRVPILYIGAAGGFGNAGLHTLSLLGSKDIEKNIVTLHAPNQAGLDFAHADLLNARNAPELVWSSIDQWLRTHVSDDHSCSTDESRRDLR